MSIPAIGRQTVLGFGVESGYGSVAVPSRFLPFTSESIARAQMLLQDPSMYPGSLQASRSENRVITGRSASGEITLPARTKGMGLLFEHVMGAAPEITQQGGTPAYKHVYRPGLTVGKSLTIQKQFRNGAGALVGGFNLVGSKFTQAVFSVETDGVLSVALSVDAQDEIATSSPATASYGTGRILHFRQGIAKFQGTEIADLVKSASVTLARPLDLERRGLGNDGVKDEPSEIGDLMITGSLTSEFANIATFYDHYVGNTPLSFELDFVGANISGIYNERLTIKIPEIHLDGESPKAGGPGTVPLTIPFTGLYNGSADSMSIEYITTDAAA